MTVLEARRVGYGASSRFDHHGTWQDAGLLYPALAPISARTAPPLLLRTPNEDALECISSRPRGMAALVIHCRGQWLEAWMSRQPRLFDLDERLRRLSNIGDQLEAFAAVVDF